MIVRHTALIAVVAFLAAAVSAGDITTGLISHWKLDETSGFVADDAVGTNNGVLTNYATPLWGTGFFNNGLSFDGVNDFVDLGNAANVQITTGTISAWVRTTNAGGSFRGILVKQNAYALFLLDNKLATFDWSGAGTRDTQITVNDDQWHHVAFAFQGGLANGSTLYLDGAPRLVFTYNIANQTQNLNFGAGAVPGPAQNINGSIDDGRLYNRRLSHDDIKALYNQGRPLTLNRITANSATQVDVQYSYAVNAASAVNLANYSINGGVTISGAVMLNEATVRLTTSPLAADGNYTVTVSNILDSQRDPPQSIAPNTSRRFEASTLGVPDNAADLLVHYKFNEAAGSTAVDSSGNGTNGLLTNFAGATWTSNGAVDGGLIFDGNDDHVQFKDHSVNRATITISAWFRTTIPNSGIIGYATTAFPTTPGGWVPVLNVGTDGILRGKVWDGNSGNPIPSPAAVNDGNFHHVVLVVNAVDNTQRIFLDNVQLASVLGANVVPFNGIINHIGICYSNGWPGGNGFSRFNGTLDDIRLYDRAMTPAEVAKLFNLSNVPEIGIAAVASATEPNIPGRFRITRSGNNAMATVVNVAVDPSSTAAPADYELRVGGVLVAGTVTIPAGAAFVDVDVIPLDDALGEGAETVVLNVNASAGVYRRLAPFNATVTINDNEPIVSIAAVQNLASERGPLSGIFTITRVNNIAAPLTVTYTITGTAANGTDYANISNSVNFIPGQSTVNINIDPIGDALLEGNETVIITLTAGAGYSVLPAAASDTVTIEDRSIVTVQATDPDAYEVGVNPGLFTFTRTDPVATALTVPFTIGGTAVAGTDYVALTGSVTFLAGSSTATATVTPIDNLILGVDTIVTVTIAANNEFAVGAATTAAVTIHTDPEIFIGGSGLTIAPNPALAGQPVTFTGVSGTAAVLSWLWSYGDGATATGQQTIHAYGAPGIYTVTVAATLADGTVSSGTATLFIGTTVIGNAGAVPPSGGGLLIGGAGVTKAAGGKLRIRFSRRDTVFSGKVSGLNFSEALGQFSLQGRQGSITVGSGATAPKYFFVLDAKGRGKSADVPQIALDLKKGKFSFTVREPGLTDFLATIGASRTAPVPNLFIPVLVQVADKAFLALTFNFDFKAKNDTGMGRLRK